MILGLCFTGSEFYFELKTVQFFKPQKSQKI